MCDISVWFICVIQMCDWYLWLICVIDMCDWYVWFKCVIEMCDSNVWLICVIDMCDSSVWFKCVIDMCDSYELKCWWCKKRVALKLGSMCVWSILLYFIQITRLNLIIEWHIYIAHIKHTQILAIHIDVIQSWDSNVWVVWNRVLVVQEKSGPSAGIHMCVIDICD